MVAQFCPGLIFDIGASEGNETAFYLEKGFEVVEVEADPVMHVTLQARFRDAIDNGRLVVFNRAAEQSAGQQIICSRNPEEQGRSSIKRLSRIPNGVEHPVET